MKVNSPQGNRYAQELTKKGILGILDEYGPDEAASYLRRSEIGFGDSTLIFQRLDSLSMEEFEQKLEAFSSDKK